MANKHNITFDEISRNASKETKRATSLSRISEAKEAISTLAKRAKRSISNDSFTSMIEHTEVNKQEALINTTLDSYHKENIELKILTDYFIVEKKVIIIKYKILTTNQNVIFKVEM